MNGWTYKIKIVVMCDCECSFIYTSRTEEMIFTKHCMPMRWDHKKFLEGWKLRKIFLNSSPVKCGSCSSETKYHRRMAPRPKLFASKRRLHKQRPKPGKLSSVRVPVNKLHLWIFSMIMTYMHQMMMPVIILQANKLTRDVIKHLSNFPD
jgi:hypothetical protein